MKKRKKKQSKASSVIKPEKDRTLIQRLRNFVQCEVSQSQCRLPCIFSKVQISPKVNSTVLKCPTQTSLRSRAMRGEKGTAPHRLLLGRGLWGGRAEAESMQRRYLCVLPLVP